ncbi:Fc.00g012250.m01.CDS01 [Cosmosporella sp. VM-42]
MSSDTAAPPYYALSDDNHAALVVVAAVVFLIYGVLAIVTKLLIRLNIVSMKAHDIVLLVGSILYFIQTVCVVVACNAGLGRHQDVVSTDSFERFSKLLYASRILALCVNACTKVSLCLLIRQIDNQGKLNLANMVLGGAVILCFFTGFFATIFQCPLPNPWLAVSHEHCPSRGPIFVYNGVMDILTDLALCALPVAMMWQVQTTVKRKIIVMALFGTRIIVPIVTIPSLTNARYLFNDYSDSTWGAVSSTMWFQISLGLSVLTACIPSLKGIIDSLLGGTAAAAIGAPYELRDSGNKKSGLEMTALGGGSNQASNQNSGLRNLHVSTKGKSVNHSTWSADRELDAKYGGGKASPEGSGSESVRKLTEGVIVVRDEFEVHYDDKRMSRDGSRGSSDAEYHMYH